MSNDNTPATGSQGRQLPFHVSGGGLDRPRCARCNRANVSEHGETCVICSPAPDGEQEALRIARRVLRCLADGGEVARDLAYTGLGAMDLALAADADRGAVPGVYGPGQTSAGGAAGESPPRTFRLFASTVYNFLHRLESGEFGPSEAEHDALKQAAHDLSTAAVPVPPVHLSTDGGERRVVLSGADAQWLLVALEDARDTSDTRARVAREVGDTAWAGTCDDDASTAQRVMNAVKRAVVSGPPPAAPGSPAQYGDGRPEAAASVARTIADMETGDGPPPASPVAPDARRVEPYDAVLNGCRYCRDGCDCDETCGAAREAQARALAPWLFNDSLFRASGTDSPVTGERERAEADWRSTWRGGGQPVLREAEKFPRVEVDRRDQCIGTVAYLRHRAALERRHGHTGHADWLDSAANDLEDLAAVLRAPSPEPQGETP